MDISVFDAMGKLILEQDQICNFGENKVIVNTSVLASGIYFLQVEISGKTFIRRIARK